MAVRIRRLSLHLQQTLKQDFLRQLQPQRPLILAQARLLLHLYKAQVQTLLLLHRVRATLRLQHRHQVRQLFQRHLVE